MPVDKNHRLIAVFDMGKPAKVMVRHLMLASCSRSTKLDRVVTTVMPNCDFSRDAMFNFTFAGGAKTTADTSMKWLGTENICRNL